MKLKMDESGKPVLDGELPVFVDEQGQEQALNVADLVAKVNVFSRDLDSLRKRAKQAEDKLAGYNGFDVDAARKALETVQKLDEKKLIDAGEVDKVKRGVIDSYEPKLAERDKKIEELNGSIRKLSVSSKIAASEYIKKNLLIPPDMFEARFGSHFHVEDEGRVVVRDFHGNPIMSRRNPGEYADPDEAIEQLINAYPARDSILRSSGAKGSGAQSGDGGQNGGGGSVRRKSDLKGVKEKAAWIAAQREAGRDAMQAYAELPD